LGRFLGVRDLYPKYPMQFVTPPGSRVRFGTRDAYVDVPWLVYRLYMLLWEYHEGGGDREEISRLTQQVESELKGKLGDYAGMYSIVGPIRRKGDRPPAEARPQVAQANRLPRVQSQGLHREGQAWRG
jgi:hypothetical protein